MARRINDQPWQPLPGMFKLRCDDCDYWFASRRGATRCPDCELKLQRPRWVATPDV